MTNLLSAGISWLDEQLDSHASTEVTYRRGSQSVRLNATLGRHRPAEHDAGLDQATVDAFDVVCTFRAADLSLGGARVTPARGDTIEFREHDVLLTYQILPEMGRWWRESDAFGLRIEVSCKLAGRA